MQFDICLSDLTWHGTYGTILAFFSVQRTIKIAEMWALYMALMRVCGLACVQSENFSVVQGFKFGEEVGVSHKHNDADWWCLILRQIDVIVEAGWILDG